LIGELLEAMGGEDFSFEQLAPMTPFGVEIHQQESIPAVGQRHCLIDVGNPELLGRHQSRCDAYRQEYQQAEEHLFHGWNLLLVAGQLGSASTAVGGAIIAPEP
jgi:hypothetical protein